MRTLLIRALNNEPGLAPFSSTLERSHLREARSYRKEADLHFKVATNVSLTSSSSTKVGHFYNSPADDWLLPSGGPRVIQPAIRVPPVRSPNHQTRGVASLVVPCILVLMDDGGVAARPPLAGALLHSHPVCVRRGEGGRKRLPAAECDAAGHPEQRRRGSHRLHPVQGDLCCFKKTKQNNPPKNKNSQFPSQNVFKRSSVEL